ncbi:B3 domain-containing protein [Cucumis melo var. makuwa]|uniref:B3 domain-containing protein n=1 Tax=Cucumis melo var. makuwa TaxID=1194695 RepID=A0A5A7TRY9_CUCMM|nr:B3 domain-containing protein [Cucumis melo var. makuwa]TYJ99468.1 B3 domain-containing protein [Cucumis melo var. makuwa]
MEHQPRGRNAILLKSSAAATVAGDDGDMALTLLARSPRHRLASSSVCISLSLSLGMDSNRCSEIYIFGYDSLCVRD